LLTVDMGGNTALFILKWRYFMFIEIGEKTYELSTKLGTAVAIERKFKLPLSQIFQKIEIAEISELADIIAIAARKLEDKNFKEELYENWDYIDLQYTVQELLSKLMFSGTPEEIERKLDKFSVPEEQKNALRKLLGLPKPRTGEASETSTGNE